MAIDKLTRAVTWIKAARKDFDAFPLPVQKRGLAALTVAAAGGKSDDAKPLTGFPSGVLEIVLKHRGDAFRMIYAVQIGADVWVIHAFQKKSTQGIKTPKHEIELAKARLKQLKEFLK